MRQPLMTAVVGLARGCNPWASVVFFGAYLCSDQLHASQDWTSESNQMVGDGGFGPSTFCSQSRRSSQTELISVVKLKIHYALRDQSQLNLWWTYRSR